MKLLLTITLIYLSSIQMAFGQKKNVTTYDRDGDQYSEEKQTIYYKGHQALKIIKEIDHNKDKKPDQITTSFIQAHRQKVYVFTKTDKDFDGIFEKKSVKIKKLEAAY